MIIMVPRNILYIIAIILFVGWSFSLILWGVGKLIHIMLIIALVAFVLGIFKKKGV